MGSGFYGDHGVAYFAMLVRSTPEHGRRGGEEEINDLYNILNREIDKQTPSSQPPPQQYLLIHPELEGFIEGMIDITVIIPLAILNL